VLIENFKVGALARYGLDYETLAAANPGLVYCSITGFGQDGPYAMRPGYDFVIQAMGGLMSLTGEADGAPMKAGVALTDLVTGLYAANAIQAALRHRDRTGQGQRIDLALLDVQVAALANQALNYLVSGSNPRAGATPTPTSCPTRPSRPSTATSPWRPATTASSPACAQALAVAQLAADPRFRDQRRPGDQPRRPDRRPAGRLRRAASTAHWLERLHAAGVPAGAVNSLDAVFADPQVIHRGLAVELPHATLGAAPGVACSS
jgi:crotonobetainyl-CoA:carnitine CoA-transferase CaiB-like acyl-CoA transferase